MKTHPEGLVVAAKSTLIAVAALGTLRLSSPASALELVWSTGEANLTVTASQPCTLLVKANLAEELPTHWFLNWAGNVDVNDCLLPRDLGPVEDVADICQTIDSSTFESRTTNRRVVQHCVAGSARVKAARYILPADQNAQLRVELVIEQASGIGNLGPELKVSAEATLNGGRGLAYRPLISGLRWTGAKGSLEVRGLHLEAIRRASCLPTGAAVAFPVAVKTQADGTLLADLPTRSVAGSLHLFDDKELVALGDFSADADEAPQAGPPERVIAWFAPRSVLDASSLPAAPLAGYDFEPPTLRDELLSAGVVALEKLFPTFAANPPEPINSAGEPVTYTDLGDMYVLHLDTAADTATMIGRLSSVPQVWYCARQSARDGPRIQYQDPLFRDQWGLHQLDHGICNGQYQTSDFSAHVDSTVWNVARGVGVYIQILDTGLSDHDDLENAVRWGCNYFLDHSVCFGGQDHGDAVAGIAAAVKDNGRGIAGVAPDATPLISQVCHPGDGGCVDDYIQLELEHAFAAFGTNGWPQVINMSFSGPAYPPPGLLGAVRNCTLAGQFLAAATGNYYELGNPTPAPEYPAALNGMVCAVGAAYMTGIRWADHRIVANQYIEASLWGHWIDLCAPGGRAIVAPGTVDGYWFVDDAHCSPQYILGMGFGGTSAAVPVISGVAALLMDYQPLVMGEDAQAIMQITALDIIDQFDEAGPVGLGWDARTGSGLVQADVALQFISPPRQLRHGAIGYLGHEGTLAVVESSAVYQQRTFKYVPNAGTQPAWCRWYRVRGHAAFNMAYTALPKVWTRASGTAGWRDSTVIDNLGDVPWARVVPNSIMASGADFETYVYKVVDNPTSQNVLTWFPDAPDRARVAFTSVGPSTINLDVKSDGLGAGGGWLRAANNPARASVSLIAGTSIGEAARIEVYDVTGRLVARLSTAEGAGGQQVARWDGSSIRGTRCGAGIYLARASWNGGAASCRFVLLR